MAKRKGYHDRTSVSVSPPALSRPSLVRDTPPRSTFRVARAQRILAASVPDLIYQKPVKPARRADPVPTSPIRPLEPSKAPPRRDDGPSLSVSGKPRDLGLCKKRPSNSRGSGGSRSFVPWCK